MEQFDAQKVWTAVLLDADQQGFPYLKRFTLERAAPARHLNLLGAGAASRLLLLTDRAGARIRVTLGGADAMRPPLEVVAADFVGVKGFKAKGRRLTTCSVESVEELEPLPGSEEAGPDELPEAETAPAETDEATSPADDAPHAPAPDDDAPVQPADATASGEPSLF